MGVLCSGDRVDMVAQRCMLMKSSMAVGSLHAGCRFCQVQMIVLPGVGKGFYRVVVIESSRQPNGCGGDGQVSLPEGSWDLFLTFGKIFLEKKDLRV